MGSGPASFWERHSRRRITSSWESRTRCECRHCSDAALSASQRADPVGSELRRQSAVATAFARTREASYRCRSMKRSLSIFALLSLTTLLIAADKTFTYPQAPKSDQSDDNHGTKAAEPHRDLENLDSDAT